MNTLTRLAPALARIALGLILTVSAVGHFLDLSPRPPLPHGAEQLALALAVSGYLMTLVKLVELVAGLLLLSGRAVPLAVVLVAPVVLNILLFHAFLAPAGLPIALVMTALLTALVVLHRGSFLPLLGDGRARRGRRAEKGALPLGA